MIEFVYISLCVSCTFVIFCNIVLEVRDLNFVGHTIVAQLTSCCVREVQSPAYTNNFGLVVNGVHIFSQMKSFCLASVH